MCAEIFNTTQIYSIMKRGVRGFLLTSCVLQVCHIGAQANIMDMLPQNIKDVLQRYQQKADSKQECGEETPSQMIDVGYFKLSFETSPIDPKEVKKLKEIVINATEISLVITYPFTRPFKVALRSDAGAFTRERLCHSIRKAYQKAYKTEAATSTIKVGQGPPTFDMTKLGPPISLNRPTTDGKFGIWGHYITDLLLHTVYYDTEAGVLTVGVDS